MSNISTITSTDLTKYGLRAVAIPSGELDSGSTSTVMTATVPGIFELVDGVCCWIKNGVATSASGFTLNVNSLGAKPVYSSMESATQETTKFNVNYTMLFVYDSTRVSGGCWVCYNGGGEANLIASTKEGKLVTILDGADDIPLRSVVCEIPYSSNGYTYLTVARSNKNMIEPNETAGSSSNVLCTRNSDYSVTCTGYANGTTRTPSLTSVGLPAGTYILTGAYGGSESTYGLRIQDGTNYYTEYGDGIEFTVDEFSAWSLRARFSSEYTDEYNCTLYPMVRAVTDTDSTFAGRERITNTIDWSETAGTIYGGTLDVTNGILTSKYASDGTLLSSPVEYDITATTINSLYGVNNIWGAAEGIDVTVDYLADTELFSSNVQTSVSQTLTSGTEIGRITIGGVETILYAPAYTDANDISY